MSESPLQDLVRDLDRDLAADPKGPGVARLLGAYAREHDDWRRYAHLRRERYTRNLVRACRAYELIVICWDEGHVSSIHNHAGQRCWMTVLDGSFRERLFDNPPTDGGLLTERSQRTFERGEVAFITDDLALHEIGPEYGPGVSLHLYAQPIAACHVYDPATGTSELRPLRYDSTAGELHPTPA